jgi:ABC-type dipeptide/oligopeptide/nickel transport system ATPase component
MLLSIQDLKVAFRMGKGVLAEAVKGVSFDIPENTTVALVGESGSGKSVTAMSVLNLLPDNASAAAASCGGQGPAADAAWPNCRRCAARKSPVSSRTR